MRLRYFFATAAFAILSSTAMAAPIAGSNGALGGIGGVEVVPVHNSCHSSTRTHGGSYRPHHHDEDCDVIYDDDDDEDDYDDCHHDVERHYLSGYGKVWHRHRGSNCHVELYEHESGPTPGYGDCIQIGPAVICH